jgi:hypothetical protein
MLMVGTMADQIGITQVIMGVAVFLMVVAATTTYQTFKFREAAGGIFEDYGTAIEYYSHEGDD